MPAIVDHERRRQQVAEVAASLIARHGIEALTVRQVAEAAGCSTTVVSHYFKGKRELLLFTYRHVAHRAGVFPRPESGWTPATVRQYLEHILPLRDESRENWRVWFAFWGLAAADPGFAEAQAEQMYQARLKSSAIFQEAFDLSGAEAAWVARRSLTLLNGLATEICFDATTTWPEDLLKPFISEIVDLILPKPTRRKPARAKVVSGDT